MSVFPETILISNHVLDQRKSMGRGIILLKEKIPIHLFFWESNSGIKFASREVTGKMKNSFLHCLALQKSPNQ